MITIPNHIEGLIPYKAGKAIEEIAKEKGLKKVVKLASNENPLGTSPKSIEAIKKHLNEIHRYTNPSGKKLINALSKKYSIPPEKIIAAHGSDSLIQYIIAAFTKEGDEVLTSEGTFIGWYVNVNKLGRKSISIPLKDYHYDLDAIAENITNNTKIIYLANPNNPTGTIFTKKDFIKFVEKVPENILIILDEAYTIYAEELPYYPNGLKYNFSNLIVLRTLSKAYGLAGLRIGFAAANAELIKILYKVRLPFEPNILAQEAAIAALEDDDFIKQTIAMNKKSLNKIENILKKLGIKYISSSANFLLILLPDDKFAILFNEECLNNGLILRYTRSFGINNGIRINSGNDDETDFAVDIIEKIYKNLEKIFDKKAYNYF